MEITEVLLSVGAPSAVMGLGVWYLKKLLDKRDARLEAKEVVREKNEILIIKSINASLTLGEATACAIRDGHCNGEIAEALTRAKRVKQEQQDFFTEQGVKNIL